MIALYRGKSLLSRTIRFFNWSPYSHAAWIDTVENCVIEAWKGRVRKTPDLSRQHSRGTEVDVFIVSGVTEEQSAAIAAFMRSQVGKRYDYRGVFHFLTRRPERPRDQERWFCSELVCAAYASAGVHLLARIPAWKVYPGMLAYSPLLQLVSTIKTRAPAKAPACPAEQGVISGAPTPEKTPTPQIAERAEAFAETQEDWPV